MYTLQRANIKGADQTAQVRRLVCAIVVRHATARYSREDALTGLFVFFK